MRHHLSVTPLVLALVSLQSQAQDTEVPKHLRAARSLVKHLNLSQTKYEHGVGEIVWSGDVKAHCDCSGFANHLLMHSYGYTEDDLKTWFVTKRPTARRYHDAFVEGKLKEWKRIELLPDAKPGDWIAIKYLDAEKGANTGHVMLIDKAPELMKDQPIALESARKQWAVQVIDSSMSGHGSGDTRYEKNAKHTGVGRGTIRAYTDEAGAVLGYTWSTESTKSIQLQKVHDFAIGRLKR